VAALLAAAPAAAHKPPTAGDLLDRHRPDLRYAEEEEYFAQPIGRPYENPRRVERDLVYGHVAHERGETWLQYWLFFAYNAQDRGIVRTGRHEGDWELFQTRLSPGGSPDLATLSQHSWAEGCAWTDLEQSRDGQTPVVYVANGSHALYSRPGTGDRPFPDPDDDADGGGRAVRPDVVRVRNSRPAWVSFEGRWGGSRAGIVPGEQSSPLGPRYQPSGAWGAPATFHDDHARPCGSGPPGRWWGLPALALGLIGVAAALALLRRRFRAASGSPTPPACG
jgi:hypothetical protein